MSNTGAYIIIQAMTILTQVIFTTESVSYLLPAVLRLSGRANRVWVALATNTIHNAISRAGLASLSPHLAHQLANTSKTIRIASIEAVRFPLFSCRLILQVNSSDRVEPFAESIELALHIGAVDPTNEVRTITKAAFAIYSEKLHSRLDRFIENLSVTARKYLKVQYDGSAPNKAPFKIQNDLLHEIKMTVVTKSVDQTKPKTPVKISNSSSDYTYNSSRKLEENKASDGLFVDFSKTLRPNYHTNPKNTATSTFNKIEARPMPVGAQRIAKQENTCVDRTFLPQRVLVLNTVPVQEAILVELVQDTNSNSNAINKDVRTIVAASIKLPTNAVIDHLKDEPIHMVTNGHKSTTRSRIPSNPSLGSHSTQVRRPVSKEIIKSVNGELNIGDITQLALSTDWAIRTSVFDSISKFIASIDPSKVDYKGKVLLKSIELVIAGLNDIHFRVVGASMSCLKCLVGLGVEGIPEEILSTIVPRVIFNMCSENKKLSVGAKDSSLQIFETIKSFTGIFKCVGWIIGALTTPFFMVVSKRIGLLNFLAGLRCEDWNCVAPAGKSTCILSDNISF